jgi:hypothetical protein
MKQADGLQNEKMHANPGRWPWADMNAALGLGKSDCGFADCRQNASGVIHAIGRLNFESV